MNDSLLSKHVRKKNGEGHAQSPIDDLRDDIAKGTVLAIVGSGVSLAATNRNPVAGWRGLLENGLEYVLQDYPQYRDDWENKVRPLIDSDDPNDLLSAADQISDKLGAPGGPEFDRWLHKCFGRLEPAPQTQGILAALRDLKVPLATTNYDSLLERATGLTTITWRDAANVVRFLRRDSGAILHIHGHFGTPSTVAFGRASYQRLIDNEQAQATLRALHIFSTLLFVGCGDGLLDPNFSQLFHWSRDVWKNNVYRHYLLARDGDVEKLRHDFPLGESRIFVSSYGKDFEELPAFIRSLAPQSKGAQPDEAKKAQDQIDLLQERITSLERDKREALEQERKRTEDLKRALQSANEDFQKERSALNDKAARVEGELLKRTEELKRLGGGSRRPWFSLALNVVILLVVCASLGYWGWWRGSEQRFGALARAADARIAQLEGGRAAQVAAVTSGLNERIDELTRSGKTLKEQHEQDATKMAGLNKELEAKIVELGLLNGPGGTVAALTGQLKDASDMGNKLTVELKARDGKVADLTRELKAAREGFEQQMTEIKDLTAQVKRLNDDLEGPTGRVTILTHEREGLIKENKRLEAMVGGGSATDPGAASSKVSVSGAEFRYTRINAPGVGAFDLSTAPVTNAQYNIIRTEWIKPEHGDSPGHARALPAAVYKSEHAGDPVQMNLEAGRNFCMALSVLENEESKGKGGRVSYALPTQEQWQYLKGTTSPAPNPWGLSGFSHDEDNPAAEAAGQFRLVRVVGKTP